MVVPSNYFRWQVEGVAQFDDITTRTDFPDQMLVMPPEGRLGDAIKLRGLANGDLAAQFKWRELGGGLRFQHGRDDAAKSLTSKWFLYRNQQLSYRSRNPQEIAVTLNRIGLGSDLYQTWVRLFSWFCLGFSARLAEVDHL